MKILHVSESLSSGVMDMISTYTRRQVQQGAAVKLIFTSRPETPTDNELSCIFDKGVVLSRVTQPGVSKIASLVRLRAAMRREVRSFEYDAIHLHSSFAGGLGRIAFGLKECRERIFYSPHAFSFLREDLSWLPRRYLLQVERQAAQVGSLILTSGSELEVANSFLPKARCYLVPNAIDTSLLPFAKSTRRIRPIVAMAGRISYQKAPWRFARIAAELHEIADFVWLGDGPPESKKEWIDGAPVEVSGWLTLQSLRQRLAQTDILLFPTLWEGSALALIEAQAIGVPAVASRIAGNRDTVVDGLSGYLCDTDNELSSRTRELILNPLLRKEMNEYALNNVRSRFDDEHVGTRLLNIYSQQGVGAASRHR